MDNLNVLEFTIKIDSDVKLDLSEDLLINVADITESYIDQPAKYAYWATLASKARSKANKLKSKIDKEQDYLKTTLTGKLDSKARQQLEIDGEKITETKVTAWIQSSREYTEQKELIYELQDKYLEADEQARLLEVGRDTMMQRKDMLISLGAQLRNELDGSQQFSTRGREGAPVDVSQIIGSKKRSNEITRKPIMKPIMREE